MGNLIIKGKGGAGNKLILQDQAGGAVITTGDSGATMASNVTGIPAAGVTGVLPVGVTGGSGLTALGTVASGTIGSGVTMPAGSVIQTKFVNSNADIGVIGHASPWHLSALDITLTTKSASSIFIIAAQYSADDTNSSSFGVGIGVYVTGAAITDEYWLYPAAHEDYQSGGGDSYMVARHTTAFAPGYAAGITFTIRVYGRFNNSNGQRFLGNGGPYYAQRHLVQEIQNV
jgi:hypothetical protein